MGEITEQAEEQGLLLEREEETPSLAEVDENRRGERNFKVTAHFSKTVAAYSEKEAIAFVTEMVDIGEMSWDAVEV